MQPNALQGRALSKRADHTIMECFDTVLLFLTDLGLRFDNIPQPEHLLNVAVSGGPPVAISSTHASSL